VAILQALVGASALNLGKAKKIAAFLGADPEKISARQHGGPLTRGQASLVGEEGPELFIPSAAGRVVSNRGLRGRGGATGGLLGGSTSSFSTVNLTVNVRSVFGGRGERIAIGEEVGAALVESGFLAGLAG
jgi:hypothetical protein